jgi:hypothetical protein
LLSQNLNSFLKFEQIIRTKWDVNRVRTEAMASQQAAKTMAHAPAVAVANSLFMIG